MADQDYPTLYADMEQSARRVRDAAISLEQILSADENATVPVNGYPAQPSVAKRVKDRIDPLAATILAAAESLKRFAGVKATAPTTRYDGSPLQAGDEYQNSSNNLRYSYTGSSWIALNASQQSLINDLAAASGTSYLGYGTGTLKQLLDGLIGTGDWNTMPVLNRVNQYGMQAMGTITGLAAALAAKMDKDQIGQLTKQLQSIGASVGANAMTLSLNPTVLDFRSPSAPAGSVNTRTIGTALSLLIPSGATLGSTSGQTSRLVLLALDNQGTIELAVVNPVGTFALDETGLISTTALSSSSTAVNVVYSATARSNLPYRLVGFVESTQPTSGLWTVSPSVLQGAGGMAMTKVQWQPFTKEFISAAQTYSVGGNITLSHNLGVKPKLYAAYIVCAVAEWGFAVGDELRINDYFAVGSTGYGVDISVDATTVVARMMSLTTAARGTGQLVGLGPSNWRIVLRVWA